MKKIFDMLPIAVGFAIAVGQGLYNDYKFNQNTIRQNEKWQKQLSSSRQK